MKKKPKVLLLGWDGADWKIIGPLMAKGQMPALKRVIERGVYGNMGTMNPPYSPMLWSSVATGKTPEKHGVLGFIELLPNMKGIRPVTVHSRKAKAIWNILHHKGYKSNLVGWWPSHPAEPINGVVVSDKFHTIVNDGDTKKEDAVIKGAVYPESLTEVLKDLRMSPFEVTDAHILPFIPKASQINQNEDRHLVSFAKVLSENVSVHCAATNLMRTTEWDFMGVYYNAIDHFCHTFMKFHPPRLKAIPEKYFEIYKDVVSNAYRFQDMMLDRMLDLIDDDTTVIIMSDHGYESGHRRILKMPKYPAAPSLEHRNFGIFVASGPEIKQKEKVYGLSLIDIGPTILHMFGLPVGKDMDGNVALDLFKDPKKPTYIDSWEKVAGDFGQHDSLHDTDQLSDQEAMEQLIELGYIERPDEKIETAILKTKCDLKFNLARVYSGKKEYDKAKPILLELIKEPEPIDTIPYYMELLSIALDTEEYDEAEAYLNKLRSLNPEFEKRTYFSESRILLGKGRVNAALKLLEKAKENKPGAQVWTQVGKIYLQTGDFKDAKEAFQRALDFEIDNARVHQLLATALVRLGHYEEAAEHALTSIELIKYFPEAHAILGEALTKMGDLENAKKAYEMVAKLRPRKDARTEKALENLEEKIAMPAELRDKTTFAYRKEQIVVVSGLPRSGTSLMMQMLDAGGLDILTDENRKADESNPKGYYEYNPVMRIHKDNSWLHLGKDKAVKIVAPLLQHIDPQYRYKVIFMKRDLHEIIKSQQKMVGKDPEALPMRLLESYTKLLSMVNIWKEKEPSVELLYVDYKEVLSNPSKVLSKIAQFIGKDLDTTAMQQCIDPSLYRNRV
ncbi:alkaline phosphatase family protein [Leptobacterium sp. I13]|uniref:alkaline phosphatase family protein n=1 Tax=Leptobacterium meishanense TaxID=3128904 RepID=UPI0030EF0EE2